MRITAQAQAAGSSAAAGAVGFYWKPIAVSQVLGYDCNGSLIAFQPKEYSFGVPFWQGVRSITIHFWGYADDFGEIDVNNGAIHWRPDVYKKEIGTPSKLWFDSTRTFPFRGSSLAVKVGANNTAPSYCTFSGGFEITLRGD